MHNDNVVQLPRRSHSDGETDAEGVGDQLPTRWRRMLNEDPIAFSETLGLELLNTQRTVIELEARIEALLQTVGGTNIA